MTSLLAECGEVLLTHWHDLLTMQQALNMLPGDSPAILLFQVRCFCGLGPLSLLSYEVLFVSHGLQPTFTPSVDLPPGILQRPSFLPNGIYTVLNIPLAQA